MLAWALSAVLVLSAAGFVYRLLQYRLASDEYTAIARQMAAPPGAETAQPTSAAPEAAFASATQPAAVPSKAAALPTPSPVPALYFNDQIRTLKADNGDTVGYLEVGGTAINYPVVQTSDNRYYETHTFLKKKNPSGAIFLDCANSANLSDFNLVIYGHNMRDGSMFHDLVQYRKATFASEHSTITLIGLFGKRIYKVFSAYTCGTSTDMRGFGFVTEKTRDAFITSLRGRSIINPGDAAPTADGQIITLVTCREDVDGNYFVVHGVLVSSEP